jgi:hypothetical protein
MYNKISLDKIREMYIEQPHRDHYITLEYHSFQNKKRLTRFDINIHSHKLLLVMREENGMLLGALSWNGGSDIMIVISKPRTQETQENTVLSHDQNWVILTDQSYVPPIFWWELRNRLFN